MRENAYIIFKGNGDGLSEVLANGKKEQSGRLLGKEGFWERKKQCVGGRGGHGRQN